MINLKRKTKQILVYWIIGIALLIGLIYLVTAASPNLKEIINLTNLKEDSIKVDNTIIILDEFIKEFNSYTELEKEEYFKDYVGKTIVGKIGVYRTTKEDDKYIVFGGTNLLYVNDSEDKYGYMPNSNELKVFFNSKDKNSVLPLKQFDIIYIKARLKDYRYYLTAGNYTRGIEQFQLIDGIVISKEEYFNYLNK